VFIGLLPSSGWPTIVESVTPGMCLPSRCLAIVMRHIVNEPIPWSGILKKLRVTLRVNKFRAILRTREFITVFRAADTGCHPELHEFITQFTQHSFETLYLYPTLDLPAGPSCGFSRKETIHLSYLSRASLSTNNVVVFRKAYM
jgi:hypothetical protein